MRRLLVLPFALAATGALAQETIYVGIGVGSFDYQESFVSSILGRVADEVTIRKLMGGFEFNEHLALEINYGKTDDIRQSGTQNVPPFGDVTDTLSTDFTITTLTAVGQLPFEWGALLAGLGYFSSENDFTDTLTSDCCEPSVIGGTLNDDGLTALLGIEWRFGRFGTRYAVRLEYQWWDIPDADASATGLTFSYGF
jgi:Outer membrane protein beta-barrel domain